jgi:hypothetical protein
LRYGAAAHRRGERAGPCCSHWQTQLEKIMGKYVLGWLLGIPAVVLVVIYFIAN